MSSVKDVSGIPTAGRSLIILAVVDHVFHFRVFDGDGKVVVDTNEQRLTEQARQIEDLRKQLESFWPPHELTETEKVRVIAALTSIVGHTQESEEDDRKPISPLLIRKELDRMKSTRPLPAKKDAGKRKSTNKDLDEI